MQSGIFKFDGVTKDKQHG